MLFLICRAQVDKRAMDSNLQSTGREKRDSNLQNTGRQKRDIFESAAHR